MVSKYKKKPRYKYNKNVGKKNRIATTYKSIPKRVYSETFNVMLSGDSEYLKGINNEFWNNALGVSNIDPTKRKFDFSLSYAQNHKDWASMFQRYKINAVVCEFTPIACTELVNIPTNTLPTPPFTTIQVPFLYTFVDPNETAFPVPPSGSNLNDENIKYMLQHKNCNRVKANKKHTVMLRPSILNIAYQDADSSQPQGINFGYTSSKAPWIELNEKNSTTFKHFGLKVLLSNASPPGRWNYNINMKYYVSFNGVRK
jgi:hypothetical protein